MRETSKKYFKYPETDSILYCVYVLKDPDCLLYSLYSPILEITLKG